MTAALEGVSGQQHALAALYPRERPGTHFTGGWVGPRAGLDGRKISSPPGFDPRTVHHVVSRYTDWAKGFNIEHYISRNKYVKNGIYVTYTGWLVTATRK